MKNLFTLCVNCLFASLLLFAANLYAADDMPSFEIYGTQKINKEELIKKYGPELKFIGTFRASGDSPKAFNTYVKQYEKLNEGIEKMGNFSYVHVSPIEYEGAKKTYITIDVVDKGDEHRINQFLPRPKKSFQDPVGLIAAWQAYDQVGSKLMREGKASIQEKVCPVYHCTFGFEEVTLRKYKPIFDQAQYHAAELKTILLEDKNGMKRATAALLLAHTKDPNFIIKNETIAAYDSEALVRNNAMRVLIETLEKVKVPDFPIEKIVIALDFPDETDRNKALYILDTLAHQNEHYKQYLVKNALPLVLKQLHSIQPNLHDPAYELLTCLSGKHFKKTDYTAWTAWVNSQAVKS